MRTKLLIVYENPEGTKALPVAHVSDSGLLISAARHAIDEKRAEANSLRGVDRNLAMIAIEEANRLEKILALLIPGLSGEFGRRHPATSIVAM
jgi:hypothetical protein